MSGTRSRIDEVLANLHGRPWVKYAFAADTLLLQFGPWRTSVARLSGRVGTVGSFSLHVQCAWRIAGPAGTVTGLFDVQEQPTREGVESLARKRLDALFRGERVLVVERAVATDDVGGACLELSAGYRLDLLPVSTAPEAEHWRLLLPTDAQFVVGADGAELLDSLVGDPDR